MMRFEIGFCRAVAFVAGLLACTSAWATASVECTSGIRVYLDPQMTMVPTCTGECNLFGQAYDCILSGVPDPQNLPPVGTHGTVSCTCYWSAPSQCDLDVSWDIVPGPDPENPEEGRRVSYTCMCNGTCPDPHQTCHESVKYTPQYTEVTCGCGS